MKKFFFVLFVSSLLFHPHSIRADEGMWMPHQMQDLNLEKLGLQIPPQHVYGGKEHVLMEAIVNFSGGTGSFVSRKGLILTNHHVGFSALQRASDEENNYLKDGFLADKYRNEIPVVGLYIDIILSYEEITDKVIEGVYDSSQDEIKRNRLEMKLKQIIDDTEKREPGVRVQIAKTFGGRHYYLYRFKRLKDIRIVYAPPLDMGKFGGEIDNWTWPRHTADFAFFRAYISPDGHGQEYHEENIPYEPKTYLKISLEGFEEDDFTFVMGYPGKTYRNDMLPEFMYAVDLMNEKVDQYQYLINFYEYAVKDQPSKELKYISKLKSLHNSIKNYRGKLEGFIEEDIYQKKALGIL